MGIPIWLTAVTSVCLWGTTTARNISTANEEWNEKLYLCDACLYARNSSSKEYINEEWNEQLYFRDVCLSVVNSSRKEYINRKWRVKWIIIFMSSLCLWGTTAANNTSTENEMNNYLYVMFVCLRGTVAKRNTSTANKQWNERLHLSNVFVCAEQHKADIKRKWNEQIYVCDWHLSVCGE